MINIKQRATELFTRWTGIFSDSFSELVPVHDLKPELFTGLGVEVQYNDIHEILGDLKHTLAMVEMIRYDGMVWDEHIRGLKKIGPTVVNLEGINSDRVIEPINMARLPAIIFLATSTQEYYYRAIMTKKACFPVFMHGIKTTQKDVNKDPDAALYLVGEYYMEKKGGFWSCFYVTIKDGQLRCPPIVRGKRQPWMESFAKWHGYSYEGGIKVTEKMCATYFNVWQMRDKYWRFSGHTPNARVSFLINPADPKYIFADRNVKAKTKMGQKKRIIHHVEAHERKVKNKTVRVRSHLRGLRNFYWGNIYCSVIAPKYHRFNIDDFQEPGADVPVTSGMVELSDAIDLIVKAENAQDSSHMHKNLKKQTGKTYRKLRREKLRKGID